MENRFAAARRRYLRTHIDGIYKSPAGSVTRI